MDDLQTPPGVESTTPSATDGPPSWVPADEQADAPDFDDDYWSDNPGRPALAGADDPVVARCADDLIADWRRRGQVLDHSDFIRTASRRSLTSEQQLALVGVLQDRGVEVAHRRRESFRPAEELGFEDIESRALDTLGVYFKQIAQHRLLRAEEEVDLGRLIEAGRQAQRLLADPEPASRLRPQACRSLREEVRRGREALDALVTANLRLAVSVARQFGGFGGLDFEDRIQAANLGLIRAAEKFDHTLGYKFSTYATWWIRQSIDRCSADTGRSIRLPVHFVSLARQVRREHANLRDRLNRDPKLSELAVHLHMDSARVQFALDASAAILSLDSALNEEGNFTLIDLLDAEASPLGEDPASLVPQQLIYDELRDLVQRLLPTRTADVVTRRFGLNGEEPETLEEIGSAYGLTRERIRQIEAKGLSTLRCNQEVLRLMGLGQIVPRQRKNGVWRLPPRSVAKSDKVVVAEMRAYKQEWHARRRNNHHQGSYA